MRTNERLTTDDLLVADVMTIDPVVVGISATIEDAAHVLRANSITGLPVVDDEGVLVGVISQTDLVTAVDSPVGRVIRGNGSGLRVGELMSSPAVTIEMTRPLVEAARMMLDQRIHRLVALDEAGRPVGVLSSMDFVGIYAGA
jgi:CBS-domain-containing membrane protein